MVMIDIGSFSHLFNKVALYIENIKYINFGHFQAKKRWNIVHEEWRYGAV